MRARTLLFPPVGDARGLLQTRQSTNVAVFPNMICSFLHLGHLILMNLLVDSLLMCFGILRVFKSLCKWFFQKGGATATRFARVLLGTP
jgi:hypothetical protein